MARIAAFRYIDVSLAEFFCAVIANCFVDCPERRAQDGLGHLCDRLVTKARPRSRDVSQCRTQLLDLILRQWPVLYAPGKAKLNMARLHDEVHKVAEGGIERGRCRGRWRTGGRYTKPTLIRKGHKPYQCSYLVLVLQSPAVDTGGDESARRPAFIARNLRPPIRSLPVSRSIRTGAKAITEPFPIHVAAELYPISRLTGLRTACQSALLFQRNALD
jgi:hypothetical protein